MGRKEQLEGGSMELRAYELWTWERCRERAFSLKGRLGYLNQLWVLGYYLDDDGRLLDPYRGVMAFDPAEAGDPRSIPYNYSGVPEMYMLLYVYAGAVNQPLTGEFSSPGGRGLLKRFELRPDEAADLLRFADLDLAALGGAGPFIGEKLEMGDFSFRVWPLPRVPVYVVLWGGDEETGCGCSVFFDSSVGRFVPGLEVELMGLTVWRLRNMLNPEVRWGYHQYV